VTSCGRDTRIGPTGEGRSGRPGWRAVGVSFLAELPVNEKGERSWDR
jgi:hypothetical protein